MLAGMAITLGVCFTFFAMMIAKSLRAPVATGREGLIGLDAEVTEDLAPEGMIKCHGEVWKARTVAQTLRKGQTATVVAVDGITLLVETKR
jgi:membrane-bound serine protease (ClpP class)